MSSSALVPLRELADLKSGGTPSKSREDYWNGDIPWISGKTLHDTFVSDSDLRLTEAGLSAGSSLAPVHSSLILVRGMSLLQEIRIGMATRPVAFNQDVKAIVARPAVSSRYLNLALRAAAPVLLDQVHQAGHGTGVLATDRLTDLPIWLPPLEEQERIAGVLGAFDDLIETNRRLVAQIREVVTSAWARALSNGPVEMPFFDAFDVRFGAPFGGSEFAPSGVGRPLIRIRDLKTLSPDTWTTQSRPDETVIEPGDVLVGMDAEFVPTYWLGASGVLNQRVMRVKSPYGGAGLCCEALRDPMAFVQGYKTGTTVAHLNKADLQTLTVRIPEDRSRAVFNEATKGLVKAVVGLAQESDDLVQQRDELLPLLMSGKVRVRDVEAAVS